MLRATGIVKRFSSALALDEVSVEVDAGQVLALLGPNGAGKTTLISIIAGLLRPDSGCVSVAGIDALKDSTRARRNIGVALQELAVYPTLTVWENLTFAAELGGVSRAARSAQCEKAADAFALTELVTRRVGELSGGQQRRLHAAMALTHRPPVLLLDEPTAGVDVSTRTRTLETVRALAEESGVAVCYTTHYLQEIEELGATVAVLDKGRIVVRGTASELVARYGQSVLELTFDGAAPPGFPPSHDTDGRALVRIATTDPTAEAARTLSQLGDGAHRLLGLQIVRPSLESVFLTLTGRRFDQTASDTSEGDALAMRTGGL